ncbi:membrane protein [Neptunitalea chrysea]|uniref:Membrane protein n=1 Tax=Neptunitalea chrysea TaxID=1647581 RepID=A0A9W6B8U2_9FLAO|nr:RagB/SusD family nutrient uptake outer membrane protein [Neptunitalea chrysea]GLB53832.1 membrane protein [Neptunitalea chrysea]
MKTIKNIIKGFSFLLLLLSVGCSLDENPYTTTTAPILFANEDGVKQALAGTYSPLRYIYGRQSSLLLTTSGTDIFQHGNDGDWELDEYSNDLNPAQGRVDRVWGELYEGVSAANSFLMNIEEVDFLDADLKATYIAEVRFIRAHFYYWLTMQWGDVVFMDKASAEVNTNTTRTAKETIWQFMLEDTQFAIDNLDWEAEEYGRITKGAALQQLVLVNMLLGNYTDAKIALDAIINQGPYALEPTFADVFDYDNQENGEIIFSIQYTNDNVYNGDGNRGHLFFTPNYAAFAGLERDASQGGRPYTRFRPTEFFRNLFEDDDTRFDETFRRVWYYNVDGYTADVDFNGQMVAVQEGDSVVWDIQDDYGNVLYQSKIAPNRDDMHWGMKKHDDPTRSSPNEKAGFRDFFVYRLAETYLLKAEVEFELGNTSEAASALNVVRNRAAASGSILPQVTAFTIDMDTILDERARELGGEEKRWIDLKRTGRLLDRVRLYNPNASANVKEYHLLRPIPQSEIDASTAGMKQNPGY